jgi:PAS domain-containing protein
MATPADVSRQVAHERRLKQAESWFASVLDGVDDFAVVSINADGRIEAVNPSVLRQPGFRAMETIGHSLDVFTAMLPYQLGLEVVSAEHVGPCGLARSFRKSDLIVSIPDYWQWLD